MKGREMIEWNEMEREREGRMQKKIHGCQMVSLQFTFFCSKLPKSMDHILAYFEQ